MIGGFFPLSSVLRPAKFIVGLLFDGSSLSVSTKRGLCVEWNGMGKYSQHHVAKLMLEVSGGMEGGIGVSFSPDCTSTDGRWGVNCLNNMKSRLDDRYGPWRASEWPEKGDEGPQRPEPGQNSWKCWRALQWTCFFLSFFLLSNIQSVYIRNKTMASVIVIIASHTEKKKEEEEGKKGLGDAD